MNGEFAALILDCDGVLVDSETIALDVSLQRLAGSGLDYPRDEFIRRFCGVTPSAFRGGISDDAGARFKAVLAEDFFDELRAAIRAEIEVRLQVIAGAGDLVAGWSRLKAVASSSSLDALHSKLKATGLHGYFGTHIYSADVVRSGKPDPDLFLHTAEQLSIDPAQCVVIEDSVNGVVAARRAGMVAYGFTGGGHCLDGHAEELAGAGAAAVFASHTALAAHLGISP